MSRTRKLRISKKGHPPRAPHQGSVPVPNGHSSWGTRPLFRPGHGSGTLWDFVIVTVGLGMTEGRRDQLVMECQDLGATSGQNKRDKDNRDGGALLPGSCWALCLLCCGSSAGKVSVVALFSR